MGWPFEIPDGRTFASLFIWAENSRMRRPILLDIRQEKYAISKKCSIFPKPMMISMLFTHCLRQTSLDEIIQ